MSAKYNVLTIINLYRENNSTCQIAKLFNTSPNAIRRILVQHNEPLRSRKDARKLALEKNPELHPTKGKHHTEESKQKASKSMKKFRELERKKLNKKRKDNG